MKKRLFLFSALALCIFGMNTTVKAENYIAESAPDKFTTKVADIEKGGDAVLDNQTILNTGSAQVVDYHTTTGLKVFCVDRKQTYKQSAEYIKKGAIDDYGIVYIIANASRYYNNIEATGVIDGKQQYEMSWFTQMAIWQYQDAEFAKLPSIIPEIAEDGTTTPVIYSTRADILWTEALKLATAAKKAQDPSKVSNLNFIYDGKNVIDKENKVVKTSMITLYTEGVNSYSLNLANAIAGTKVYNEQNYEITDLNNVTAKKFYLVMPIENVDNYTYDFAIVAKATGYNYYNGYKYETAPDQNKSYQPLVLVTKEAKDLDANINISGSHLEDTASSVVNTIYLVGFLILISGAGLVYLNTKQKAEQN